MKILFVTSYLPHPAAGGSAIRSYNFLKQLSKRHEITLCAYRSDSEVDLDNEPLRALGIHLETVPLTGKTPTSLQKVTTTLIPAPHMVQAFERGTMKQQIRTIRHRWQPDLIHCDLLRMSWGPAALDWQLPSVLDQHNVEYKRMQSQLLARAQSAKERGLAHWEIQRIKRYERDICKKNTHVVTVTDEDTEGLTALTNGKAHITTIPVGVDTNYFKPVVQQASRPKLIFAGTMSYEPNEDAMLYFCYEILPRIVEAVPDVALTIIGRNPTAKIAALADDPRITVTGAVPDVRPYFAESSVCVIPVRIGGGIKQKLLEAMVMGMPVVTNSFSKIGIPLKPGVHAVVEDDAEPFAEAVISLLGDQARCQALGSAAARFIRAHFSWDRSVTQLEAVYEQSIVDHCRNKRN